MHRLKNRVVIVTGGASGIGKSTCLVLAKHGATIAITDIQSFPGEQVANMIKKNGGLAEFWEMDVTKEAEIQKTVSSIEKNFEKIDVLVNNAGITIGSHKPTHERTEKEWDNIINVNSKGAFLCTKHVIPYMLKQKSGSIINISSIYGKISAAGASLYSASKGAITLMTKSDALLYAKDNIRVNSIHPGHIWTPLLESIANNLPQGPEKFKTELESLYPLGRLADPEDIAYGVLYLASDESKFITGSELVIDGGYTAK